VDGVLHYCVANMPGAVPRTSTFALNNQTMPFVLQLANDGLNAVRKNAALKLGLNTHQGHVTYAGVANAFSMEYAEPEQVLA
jgi:alanine dehydrogenase